MATYDFVPTQQNPPFLFQPTLDGVQYTATVGWNLFGQRWYMALTTLDGTLIDEMAVIGSPAGLVLQTITWDAVQQIATAETLEEHGYPIASTLVLRIAGAAPDGFNGQFEVLITTTTTFTWPLTADPGNPGATSAGLVFYDISLVAGYFSSSLLVYREAAQQFEVLP